MEVRLQTKKIVVLVKKPKQHKFPQPSLTILVMMFLRSSFVTSSHHFWQMIMELNRIVSDTDDEIPQSLVLSHMHHSIIYIIQPLSQSFILNILTSSLINSPIKLLLLSSSTLTLYTMLFFNISPWNKSRLYLITA